MRVDIIVKLQRSSRFVGGKTMEVSLVIDSHYILTDGLSDYYYLPLVITYGMS